MVLLTTGLCLHGGAEFGVKFFDGWIAVGVQSHVSPFGVVISLGSVSIVETGPCRDVGITTLENA